MLVKMKLYEKMCNDYCQTHKAWDANCIAKDAWLAGFKAARKMAIEINDFSYEGTEEVTNALSDMGREEVEVEFRDGGHQLGRGK